MTRTLTREPALRRLPWVLSSLGSPGQAVQLGERLVVVAPAVAGLVLCT